jgi:regulator of sirC expression with transglutaminase-like and TPR domain
MSTESRPLHCHPGAFDLFRSWMGRVETTEGLCMTAIAIAMHAMPQTDPEATMRGIHLYSERVKRRVRTDSVDAKLAHLHDVLFDEGGFVGNSEDYYNPRNSYVPAVLESKKGLPITLSLIYKTVAEEAGLKVVGINAPLHFMVGVKTGSGQMLVDPFFSGRVLSRAEAFDRIEQVSGRVIPRVDELLPEATHRQWLERILQNLMNIFEHLKQWKDRDAMLELRGVLMTEG